MSRVPTAVEFEKTKALCALQGTMVITDETSPFKWVGSNDAETCIIILVHNGDSCRGRLVRLFKNKAQKAPDTISHKI